MKKERLACCVFLVLFAIILLGIGSSKVYFYDENLKKSYAEGEFISGKINVSFENEKSSSIISSSFKGNISLLKLLEENDFSEGDDFYCSGKCGKGFKNSGTISEKQIQPNSPLYVGFKINGDNIRISSMSFVMKSNLGASCARSSIVDIGAEEKYFVFNDKYTDTSCSTRYEGCFNKDLGTSEYELAEITNTEYCELLSLPSAPAYFLGAKLTNTTKSVSTLSMSLIDEEGREVGKCTLPTQKSAVEEIGCVVNYSSAVSADYFVCVKSSSPSSGYKIKTEGQGKICGSDSMDLEELNRDYEIFAKSMQFAQSNMKVDKDMFKKMNDDDLVSYIDDYLDDKYDSNCSKGCIFPMKITGESQLLSFENPKIEYYSGNTLLSNELFYLLEENDSTLDSESLEIELLPAKFKVPSGSGERKWSIYSDSVKITNIIIEIGRLFDFDILPKKVLIGVLTEFEALSSRDIKSSEWYFGNGIHKKVNGSKASYRYAEEGDYEIKVLLNSTTGTNAEKTFSISVGNAKDSADALIKDYDKRIKKIENFTNTLPSWIKEGINKKINLDSVKSELVSIKNKFNLTNNNEGYLDIVNDILAIKVPLGISVSKSGIIPLVTGMKDADLSYLEKITGKTSSDEEKTISQITRWINENYDSNINFKTYSAIYDNSKEELLSSFLIDAKSKGFSDDVYLIVGYPIAGLVFKQSYGEKSVDDGFYVGFKGDKEIEFYADGEVEAVGINAYLSPNIDVLQEIGFNIESQKEYPSYLVVSLIIGVLIVILIVYLILQEWYKRYYESSLFANSDELYNLITFIHNARKQMDDGGIKNKLKSSGWSNEQIGYAIKKIDGKRTGMWEIPLFKFFENRRVNEEIERRTEKEGGVRFIKRPSF